ncbi:hypothetical protein QRX60_16925 [Amycolatopsis mongoliensis]|uniref:Uncharacterized protein n=1 Tax=Amycolatopsis mongoliensis TaxID=715475 RepID=A0A9Y2JY62_9PSEU|nr:hypothetical protein [Amycolatopsis sp. 4-36]WIY05442.1 hypothetical protein QRX60_16925 [Amycolatopsis sp. 4-36]
MNDLFDAGDSVPSWVASPAMHPAELVNRTVHFAEAAREGRLRALDAIVAVEAEVLAYVRHLGDMAATRDAEVTRSAEGKVAADPTGTSARAARLVEPRTGNQRGAILRFIVEGNGSTDFEIARDLRILPNSVRPRRGELTDGGYVVDSGRTRRHRGSDWVVWEATDEARAWYARTLKESA